jgi:hypothetical protein
MPPEWPPRLSVRDLRLGQQVFDPAFWREGEETRFEVTRSDAAAIARSGNIDDRSAEMSGDTVIR